MHIMFLVVLGNRKALCFVSCQLLKSLLILKVRFMLGVYYSINLIISKMLQMLLFKSQTPFKGRF